MDNDNQGISWVVTSQQEKAGQGPDGKYGPGVEIAFLLGLLGSTPPPAPGGPPGAPPASVPPVNPADLHILANLATDAERRRAESFIGLWPAYLASGRHVSVPIDALDGTVNTYSVALHTLGLDVWVVGGQAVAYLAGESPPDLTGAIIWHPGDNYRPNSLTVGGGLAPSAYVIAALPLQSERDTAQAIVEDWPGIYLTGQLLTMPQSALDGSLNVYSAAIATLGWEVVIPADRPYAYPAGEGSRAFPGAPLWHPGDVWTP